MFADRLINEKDLHWVEDNLLRLVFLHFKMELRKEDSFDNIKKPLIFVDFMKRGTELKQRVYEEVPDFVRLNKCMQDYMMEDTKLNLVLFSDAVKNICRVARVLRLFYF